MNIVIIEDEVLAANKLEQMIVRHNPDYSILQKVRSVEAATNWFNENPMPDLLFLDIHLLDGTCFDILNSIEITCPVIFTTAFDSYALDAFQLPSIAYLLKPINFAKLQKAFLKLESMQGRFQKTNQVQNLNEVLAALENKSQVYKSRFMIKSGVRLFSIAIEQICYFFSEDRITFLVTKDGKKHSIHHTLDEIEDLLDPSCFFRINRQMLIHIQGIKMVHKYFKGRLKIDLIPPYNEDVLVSSRRVTDFQIWLDG